MFQKMHEIFQYPFERDTIDQDFSTRYLKNLTKEARKARIMNLLYMNFTNKSIEKVDYVFFGLTYMDLINTLEESTAAVIGGIKNKKAILFKNNRYLPIYYFLPKLLKIFHHDPTMKKESTKKFVLEVVNLFKNISAKYLIVPNDSLFLERFLIFCAKEAGVKTICIQHGIVQSVSNPVIFDGKFADFMYVWSEKQKSIFIAGGLSPSKVVVFGYPYEILASKKFIEDSHKLKICILGQPWEKYSKKLGMKKKETFENLKAYLSMYNLRYKPHPGEIDTNFMPTNIDVYHGNLINALNSFDIFISLTSTALIEASIYGKISIQLYDESFQCDSFDEMGYCYTIPTNRLSQITEFIEDINSAYNIPQNVIKYNNNLGNDFLSLVAEKKSNINMRIKNELIK